MTTEVELRIIVSDKIVDQTRNIVVFTFPIKVNCLGRLIKEIRNWY